MGNNRENEHDRRIISKRVHRVSSKVSTDKISQRIKGVCFRPMKEERYITTPKFAELIKKIMKEQTQIEDYNK